MLVRGVLVAFALASWAGADSIAWYGTWDSGLAAAKATNRPILLLSAAPHCHHISGIW